MQLTQIFEVFEFKFKFKFIYLSLFAVFYKIFDALSSFVLFCFLVCIFHTRCSLQSQAFKLLDYDRIKALG